VALIDGLALCQSNAILIYLAQHTERFGGQPSEWQSILEWLAWETNRVGFSVPNLRFSLLWMKQPPEVLSYLRHRAIEDLRTLDRMLHLSEFLLPSGPTIADLSCSAYLFWLAQAGIDEGDYPSVQRWLNSLRKLPGWAHPDNLLTPDPEESVPVLAHTRYQEYR
jgi:glutathione S-transferase